MKKVIWMMAMLAAVVVAGQAWAGSSCCPMSGKKADKADKACTTALSGIELTADQQAKIDAIEDECKKAGSTVEACSDSMAKIRDVLTEEQRVKFDAASAKSTGKKGGCS